MMDKSIKQDTKTCFGIDFGTRYCTVGVWRNNNVEIIANETGRARIPHDDSILYKVLLARSSNHSKANTTTFSIKRLLGWRYHDEIIDKQIHCTSCNIVKSTSPTASNQDRQSAVALPVMQMADIDGVNMLYPQEVVAIIFSHIAALCKAHVGEEIKQCVIAVPALFCDAQRRAILDAAQIAGLEVLRLITDPTAASIGCGAPRNSEIQRVVVDIGAGTLDVALLSIEDGIFEVRAVSGNEQLGGNDFDDAIMHYVLQRRKLKHVHTTGDDDNGVSASEFDGVDMDALRTECERAKCLLSDTDEVDIVLDAQHAVTMTRSDFETLCMHHFERILDCIENVLTESKQPKSSINQVLLIGGSSNIPIIRQMIINYFDGNQDLFIYDVNNDSIARGATLMAAVLCNAIDSESDGRGDMIVLEVSPSAYGIESSGGQYTVPVIQRNNTIPCRTSHTYTTYMDNQRSVPIKVYVGNRQLCKNNYLLGEFNICGISPRPRGVPLIEVKFHLDVNGVLEVAAEESKMPHLSVVDEQTARIAVDSLMMRSTSSTGDWKVSVVRRMLVAYIRQIQVLLESDIPTSICDLCFAFYYC